MSSEESIIEIDLVTTKDVQDIIRLAPFPAKELLANILGIPPYIDELDPQKELFISFLYDVIIFTVEKGFPYEHVGVCVDFANRYLKAILVQGHKLVQGVTDFKELAPLLGPLCETHQKQITDFIFETILQHYNLYKFVFTHLRDEVKPMVEKEVVVPPIPPPLSTGEEMVIWEYNEQVKKVEKEERIAKGKQIMLRNKMAEAPKEHKTVDDVSELPLPFNKMSLKELISDVVAGYTKMKEQDLTMKVDEMVTDLHYKFEKTIIPRPAILGPPPRFKPKTPDSGKASRTSLKTDKDKKGSLSARSKSGRNGTPGK